VSLSNTKEQPISYEKKSQNQTMTKRRSTMNRSVRSIALVSMMLILLGGMSMAHAFTSTSFDLAPVNAACLPDATGKVTVVLKEDGLGVDALKLKVSGLPPNTDFAVFLTSADGFAVPPFGSTDYLADFTTNADGKGSLKIVRAIIGEAFLTTVGGVPPVRSRTDLDHLVFWFADPAQVPACFNFTVPTPFDGDGNAGPAAMSSVGATGLELLP
jgi:hypothetical protein